MSKGIFWTDPNDELEILDQTEAAMRGYGYRYGADCVNLREEHIKALLDGKVIAFNDSEYTTFLRLVKEGDNDG